MGWGSLIGGDVRCGSRPTPRCNPPHVGAVSSPAQAGVVLPVADALPHEPPPLQPGSATTRRPPTATPGEGLRPIHVSPSLRSGTATAKGRLVRSGSRGGHPPQLPQNRTCVVHIRLFGTAGCKPRRRPGYDLAGTSVSSSCTGAGRSAQIARNSSSSDTSPRSAKYALRSPRSTAGSWLNAQRDLRPA